MFIRFFRFPLNGTLLSWTQAMTIRRGVAGNALGPKGAIRVINMRPV